MSSLATHVPPDAVAEQIDLIRRRVVNVVGHELRTPITTLRGLADELEACDDDALRAELITAVARLARRVDRLVEELLLASGVGTTLPVGDAEPVDVAAAARMAWTARTGTADGPVTGTAVARARPASVRRIIDALLDNAVRHGDEPIEVVVGSDDGRPYVEVSSGGPELAPGDVELACEPFFRGERAVTTAPGLGLGLAVARTLARAERGDLVVGARPGGGVVARLVLPAPA